MTDPTFRRAVYRHSPVAINAAKINAYQTAWGRAAIKLETVAKLIDLHDKSTAAQPVQAEVHAMEEVDLLLGKVIERLDADLA